MTDQHSHDPLHAAQDLAAKMNDHLDAFLHTPRDRAQAIFERIVGGTKDFAELAVHYVGFATVAGEALRQEMPHVAECGHFGAAQDERGVTQTAEQIVAAAANHDRETLHALVLAVVGPLDAPPSPQGFAAALFASDVLALVARAAHSAHARVCSIRL